LLWSGWGCAAFVIRHNGRIATNQGQYPTDHGMTGLVEGRVAPII